MDRHHEQHVDLVQKRFEQFERCRRIQSQADATTGIAKLPSMMSQWIQSAPASSTLRTSPARFEKSAARTDGATITFGIAANVQRSTLNVQRSIERFGARALGFRASARPPLYIKSLTAGRAVSCYRVS